jgi:hypothetical protein
MAADLAELLVRILTRIFKNRPYIAFYVFLLIIAAVLGIWLLTAKSPDDRIFPIIALGFVLLVFIGYTIVIIRRWSIIKAQTYGEPSQPPAHEPELVQSVPATAAKPYYPQTAAPEGRPSFQASHLIIGALMSVLMSAPLVVISSLAIAFSPIIEDEMVEGVLLVVGVLTCLLVPVAAGLGGLFSAMATRRARRRDVASLNRLALLVGGGTGLVIGIISLVLFYLLVTAPVPVAAL